MQSPVKNRKTMDSFYVFGDLHVFSDGTVQNMARGGKRWLGALSGPYYQVTNRGHSYYVHRLVAEGFCPRHSRNFDVVDHVNGKSNDYRNLRWVNPRLNSINNRQLGVIFEAGYWRAYCCGRTLGRYRNSHHAIRAVQEAKRAEYNAEFLLHAGYEPQDTRMSFEFAPYYRPASLIQRTLNHLRESHENVELGPFAHRS